MYASDALHQHERARCAPW